MARDRQAEHAVNRELKGRSLREPFKADGSMGDAS
jgi:hypothetical protein